MNDDPEYFPQREREKKRKILQLQNLLTSKKHTSAQIESFLKKIFKKQVG